MLKKANRLSGFRTKAKGQVYNTPLFNVNIFSGENEKAKFGFVVSKKVDKRAVVRNKTKRVLGEAAKEILGITSGGKNIVIFAKTKLDFSQTGVVAGRLKEIVKKAGTD